MNYELVRNADVNVTSDIVNGATVATITVDNKYQHSFSKDSRVTKQLLVMTPADLGKRLSGGHYFFVDNTLVDFRDGGYSGFVQTDKSIDHLVETIGITRASDLGRTARMLKGNTVSHTYVLGNIWSNQMIDLPFYNEGGEFNSQLCFCWNPFVKNINTFFQLIRLLCDNGMVGLANFLNRKIPLINRWEENLNIANIQIQNKVANIISHRMKQMSSERATIDELDAIHRHALVRRERYSDNNEIRNAEDEGNLDRIIKIVDPIRHLGGVYRSSIFENKQVAAQMPGHLTTFDAYNIATELRSHYNEYKTSTNLALDRYANRIIFDRPNLIGISGSGVTPTISAFSDPDAAYFGRLQ